MFDVSKTGELDKDELALLMKEVQDLKSHHMPGKSFNVSKRVQITGRANLILT